MGAKPKTHHDHATVSCTRKSSVKTIRETPTEFRVAPADLDLRAFDRKNLNAAIAEVTRPGRIKLAVSADRNFEGFSNRINDAFIELNVELKLRASPSRKETKRALAGC